MKVFNGADKNGCDTGEVILHLTKKEAIGLVALASEAAKITPSGNPENKLHQKIVKRLGKGFSEELERSALCF